MAKRLMDITLIAAALFVLLPILLGIVVLVRMALGSPVLFRQTRIGLNGQPFTMYKFRTMLNTTCRDGTLLHDAQRVTTVGRLLRRSSLDELPELFNVLRGEMSLVGPRPLLPQYVDRYTEYQFRRHEVLPGITGWAQVNGRNLISWEERFQYDVWYVDHWSVGFDIKILGLTAWNVLIRKGVSPDGQETMDEFLGVQTTEGSVKRNNP